MVLPRAAIVAKHTFAPTASQPSTFEVIMFFRSLVPFSLACFAALTTGCAVDSGPEESADEGPVASTSSELTVSGAASVNGVYFNCKYQDGYAYLKADRSHSGYHTVQMQVFDIGRGYWVNWTGASSVTAGVGGYGPGRYIGGGSWHNTNRVRFNLSVGGRTGSCTTGQWYQN